MPKRTTHTETRPKAQVSEPSGLIAKKHRQSAEAKPSLDNRSHRTRNVRLCDVPVFAIERKRAAEAAGREHRSRAVATSRAELSISRARSGPRSGTKRSDERGSRQQFTSRMGCAVARGWATAPTARLIRGMFT
jgi:hypothetical protein